jgi:hypothetical protein
MINDSVLQTDLFNKSMTEKYVDGQGRFLLLVGHRYSRLFAAEGDTKKESNLQSTVH